MQSYNQEPIEVLRQGLSRERLMDEDVLSSVVILADTLGRLKALSPMFEGICFSPDIEALMAANMTAAAN